MQYLSSDMAQIQVDEEAARRRQEQAQRLMQAGFNPVPNANPILSILASVMSTIKGDSMLKDSDAKLSETLAKRFEIQNQQDQAKAEAERKRRDEDYQRELDKIGYTKEVEAKYREPSKIDPLSAEGIAATLGLERAKAGMRPGPGLSESDRKIQQLRALGATDDQIRGMLLGNQGSNAPSGYRATATGALEPIPGGPADKPKETDPRAAVAHDALRFVAATTGTSLAELEKMTPDQVATHFEKNSSPIAGPWLGNLPGAGITTNAILKEMAAKQARVNNPKGQVTDADFKAAEAGLPAINRLDSANAEIIRNMLMQAQGGQVAPQAQPQAPQAPAQGQPTQTATNPQTGQKIGLINGQWVPI